MHYPIHPYCMNLSRFFHIKYPISHGTDSAKRLALVPTQTVVKSRRMSTRELLKKNEWAFQEPANKRRVFLGNKEFPSLGTDWGAGACRFDHFVTKNAVGNCFVEKEHHGNRKSSRVWHHFVLFYRTVHICTNKANWIELNFSLFQESSIETTAQAFIFQFLYT